VAVPAWGVASAASSGDVPLHFYWELSAGKAEGIGQEGGAFEPDIRVTDPPPPGAGD